MTSNVFGITAELAKRFDCRTGIDIGCGGRSPLSPLRKNGFYAIGAEIDQPSIEASSKIMDRVVRFDILNDEIESVFPERFDIVCMIGVIEHLPKSEGWKLLNRCEALTRKLVIVETPNGFQPQGPEFGNEHQRHLSGWFGHDFEGLGYTVWGTTGFRPMMGYAAGNRLRYTGHINNLLSSLLNIRRNYGLAYNLLAWKDVRGVPARLS